MPPKGVSAQTMAQATGCDTSSKAGGSGEGARARRHSLIGEYVRMHEVRK